MTELEKIEHKLNQILEQNQAIFMEERGKIDFEAINNMDKSKRRFTRVIAILIEYDNTSVYE